MTKPETVTSATFELANDVKHWFHDFGMRANMMVSADNNQQMWVLPEFSMNDLVDHGIDVYDMPNSDAAWCDWLSAGTVVIGPNALNDEPINEDEHNDVATALQADLRW